MADDIASQLEGAVESLGRFRDSLEDNNIRLGNSASIEAKINKLEADKLKLLEKANKAEGKRMKDLTSGMGKAAKSMGKLAMKLGVVGGILTMFKGVVDVLLKVDRHAAKFAKQMGMTRKSTERLFQDVKSIEGSFTNMGLSLGDALHTAGALAQEFGQVSRVTKDMVVQTGQFAKAFGIGVESAAQLTEHLTRSGEGMDFINKGLQQAHISGNALGVVARDLTKNAGMIELYLSRGDDSILDMANRAAGLGKSLESFGKMSEAWSDVEAIGENIGKTAQLLGPAFEDGLGDLTELYKMYQNFQDDELHQKITEQLAKTMKLEKGILISRQTGEALTRSQIEQAAKLYGGDTEFMLRSIKYEKDYQAFQKSKLVEQKAFQEMSRDEFGALQDAAREVAKEEKNGFDEGIDLLTVQAGQQERLLELAQKRLKERKAEANVEADLKNILSDSMGVFEKIMNMVKTIMEPVKTAISTIFDKAFMEDFDKTLKGWGATIEGIFSGEGDGAFNMQAIANKVTSEEDGGILAAFRLLSTQIRTGFLDAITLKGEDGSTLTGESSTWGDVVKSIIDTYIEPPMKEFIDWMADEIFNALNVGFTKWKSGNAWADWLLPDTQLEDMQERLELLQEAVHGSSAEKMMLEYNPLMHSTIRDAAAGKNRPGYIAEIASLKRRLGIESTNALGRVGGNRHRGIVGEAGTEVGITRSALRELSSAGIPGYQGGYYAGTQASRTNIYQAPGSMRAQNQRAADNQAVGELYRNSQRQLLDGLWRNNYDYINDKEDLDKKEADIRYRQQKEFFIKYPAVVDEALGRPFREAGGATEGIYNAIFSGMQAGVRAEMAGASAERQREIAWQHSVAEGIKPGGIINQGLDKLGAIQNKQMYVLNNGVEIEKEKTQELRKTYIESSKEWSRALYTGDKEKIKELQEIRDSNYEALQAQEEQVKELQKIKNNGVAQNRVTSSLLGGIRQGMTAMAGVIASGGSREQALEMGKRGAVGGIIESFTAGFGGKADSEFLQTMNMMGYLTGTKKLPAYTGGNVGDMITEAFNRTERTFQGQGRGLGWGGANAQGRVYNSPHLAVVGEGSQNEIIVPTERIRKGLPINEGVARELASIGVPGYKEGYVDKLKGQWGSDTGGWKTGVATAGLQFANTYMQTGDMGQAAGQGIGAAVGFGATMALSAIPGVGPFIGPILGPMIGSFVGGKLGGWLGYKPKHGTFRGRAMKLMEDHARTGGQWDHGQPGGAQDLIMKALAGGKKKHPSPEAFEKLKTAIRDSPVLGKPVRRGGGVEPFIALLSGQVGNASQEDAMYRRYNNAFTGNPLVAMAKGGIVTGPTQAVIGEAGPEAVIPLDRHDGYPSRQQQEDQKNIITELRKQNQQMGMFIKNMGNAKTVLQVDGRQLAETVGSNMYDMNQGV